MMSHVKKTAKQILAGNLKALMEARPELNSQPKIAAKASKAEGRKNKVAQTTVSNMLNPNSVTSPSLRNIEAVASVFGLQAWQLLHPTLGNETVAAEVVARLVAAPKKHQSIIYQILEMDPVPDHLVAKSIPPVKATKYR